MNSLITTACCGCGAVLEERTGPTHRYMLSSPACWAVYGEVLAREYSDPELMKIHRLTVDAYAVQHPGEECPSAIHSVALHLMRLCLLLERNIPMESANEAMTNLVQQKEKFFWLPPPPLLGSITVVDVWNTKTIDDHKQEVRNWAMSVWKAWAPNHSTIHAWLRPQ